MTTILQATKKTTLLKKVTEPDLIPQFQNGAPQVSFQQSLSNPTVKSNYTYNHKVRGLVKVKREDSSHELVSQIKEGKDIKPAQIPSNIHSMTQVSRHSHPPPKGRSQRRRQNFRKS